MWAATPPVCCRRLGPVPLLFLLSIPGAPDDYAHYVLPATLELSQKPLPGNVRAVSQPFSGQRRLPLDQLFNKLEAVGWGMDADTVDEDLHMRQVGNRQIEMREITTTLTVLAMCEVFFELVVRQAKRD